MFAVSADSRRAVRLSVFLACAGSMHFVAPKFYDAMIPEALPGTPRMWTYGAGVAELTTAAAIMNPRTRGVGGLAAAWLFAAVLPGNIKQAVDARKSDSTAFQVGTLLRLPMQWPLISWALKVRDSAR